MVATPNNMRTLPVTKLGLIPWPTSIFFATHPPTKAPAIHATNTATRAAVGIVSIMAANASGFERSVPGGGGQIRWPSDSTIETVTPPDRIPASVARTGLIRLERLGA